MPVEVQEVSVDVVKPSTLAHAPKRSPPAQPRTPQTSPNTRQNAINLRTASDAATYAAITAAFAAQSDTSRSAKENENTRKQRLLEFCCCPCMLAVALIPFFLLFWTGAASIHLALEYRKEFGCQIIVVRILSRSMLCDATSASSTFLLRMPLKFHH